MEPIQPQRGLGVARVVAMLVAVGVGILLLWDRQAEPQATLKTIATTLCSSRPSALSRELQAFVAEEATVQQVDPGVVLRGRHEVLEHAERLRHAMPNCSVDLSFESSGSDERQAWAVGEVRYSASQAFDLHARRRPVRMRLQRRGQELQLTQLWIGPQQRSLPEARP